MIDILKDIVKHTHGLGFLDLVKITGDDKETAIDSMAEDRSVILQGSFHKPQTEMTGTFGMPQMGKLHTGQTRHTLEVSGVQGEGKHNCVVR